MKPHKVFCLGFHRSGTTSFQTALEELGYRVVGMRRFEWDAYAEGNYDKIQECIKSFDAFRDMPWPLMYQWLFENVPNAKFVLTTRDADSWVESCRTTYKNSTHPMISSIYGVQSFTGNEEHCKRIYLEHIERVRSFFKGRDDIFLEIDLARKAEWAPLCQLLGEPVPGRHFPHAHRRPRTLLGRAVMRGIRWTAPTLHRRLSRDK